MNLLNEKSHSEANHYGSKKNILAGSSNNHNPNRPIKLTQEQIEGLVGLLPPTALQARRFVTHLGLNPDSKTSICNVEVLSVNLSDLAVKYNPYLISGGYELRCRLPERLIKNHLNEPTMQHLWGIYKVRGAS